MSTLSFVKYHGAGNDFILIDDRARFFSCSDSQRIQQLCDRKFGVGADGLILLQLDSDADFRMRIFNSDGKEAEKCGNGLRCLARLIEDLGFVRKKYQIATGSGPVEISFEGDLIAVDMGFAERLQLNLATEVGLVHFIHTGVPHVVQFVQDIEAVDLPLLGSYLRHHPQFSPYGTNVNVVSLISPHSLQARTFERGVEGETLACGTGAVAIAVIAKNLYHLRMPLSVHFKGGELLIDESRERLKMIGPAIRVYQGFC